jgi:c-di-GMP-binding flagellar brake protein YcgR
MQVQTGAALQPASRAPDRRRHRRVPLALLGRYMLASRHEYPCQSVDMSPGGLALVAPVQGLIGERIVVYLDSIGRLEGQIVRHTEHGMALSFTATVRKRDKLASQLTWLANRQSLGLPEDRRHERIAPRHTAVKVLVDQRHEFTGRLIDISLSGVALTTELRPEIGTSVTIGRTPARVVRRFDAGIAVEFLLPLSPDRFDENLVL